MAGNLCFGEHPLGGAGFDEEGIEIAGGFLRADYILYFLVECLAQFRDVLRNERKAGRFDPLISFGITARPQPGRMVGSEPGSKGLILAVPPNEVIESPRVHPRLRGKR